MPPLIFLVIAGAGLYAGYKLITALKGEAGQNSKVEAVRRKQASAAKAGAKDLGELEWDEKSGAYIPKKSL